MNKRSIFTTMACIAAFALVASTTGMANVLTNAGFETGAVLNAAPVAGAASWTSSGATATASATNNPTRTGIGSLKLTGAGGFGVPLVSQTFAASPGQIWDFQGYMLTPSTLPADATFGLLKIEWLNAGNTPIAPGTAIIGGANNGGNPGVESTPFLNNVSTTNVWNFTQARGLAPAGTVSVRLIALLVDQSAGTAYFDDLKADKWSSVNVLTNAGFETDAVLNAAPVAGATAWNAFNGSQTASATNDPTRTGIGSLRLPGGGGFSVPGAYQTFAASPGQIWDFQGYMLTPNTLPADATFGLLKIVWSDGASDLPPVTANIGTAQNGGNPGIESTPFLNSGSATNTWIFTQAQGVAPSGTTQVKVFALMIDQSAGTGYLDDLQASVITNAGPPVVVYDYPTNNAPTPTNSAASVLSMYNSSGTYTDHGGINWYAPWSGGGANFVITNPPGSSVLKKLGMTFWGVEFYSPNQVDTTGYNTLHVDVWTPNANQFGIQLVSLSPTAAAQVNRPPSSGAITSNQWVSLNIPLSEFTTANPSTVMSALQQLLFLDDGTVGPGVTAGNFYVDNVYFYSNAVVVPPPTVLNYPTNAAPTPTRAAATVVSLYNSASNYTTVPIDTWLTGWSAASYADYTITNAANRVVKRYGALNYAGVEFFNPKINASGMSTFHVDLWTPNANKFSVKLVSFAPGAQEYEVVFTNNVIVTNNWVSLDIPISTFTTGQPAMDFANLGQLLFINNNPGGPQFGTFFIDNVYFYATATRPTILSPAASGGNFTAQSASQVGFNYVLQGTPVLAPATWTNLQTNAGTGGTLTFTIPITPGSPQRFFRINVQ